MTKQKKSFNPVVLSLLWCMGCYLLLSPKFAFAQIPDTTYHLIQEPAEEPISVRIPTSYSGFDFCNCHEDDVAAPVKQRPVNTEIITKHLSEKEFQYERTVNDEAKSFWANFKSWLMRKIFGNITPELADRTLNIIYWILALFGIVVVAVWLYRSEFFGAPMQRTTRLGDGLMEETARSEEDIESRILSALAQKNYSIAIRWVYIKAIKLLSQKQVIKIRQDKTNYDYFLEIKSDKIKEPFRSLTRIYEYSNYGKFDTEVSHYQESDSLLKSMSSIL